MSHDPLTNEKGPTGKIFEVLEFIREIAAQIPEKPDFWCSCGQCDRNIDRAKEIISNLEKQ